MATPGDAPEVAEIYRPVVAGTAISFEMDPPSAAEMAQRIAGALGFAPWLVCDDGGRVAGYAYASRHRERAAYRWCVDVSVYVREGLRRGGVGRALYTSLFALLRLQGFCAAHAGVTLPNPASVGLHESLAFVPVGIYRKVGYKGGAWHDVGWWQLELRERRAEPPRLLTMDELRRSPGFEQALASPPGATEPGTAPAPG
jgi:phosphinothricin acetyltransferase